MTVKQIEEQFGLPARIRIPIEKIGTNELGSKFILTEYLHRTITKRLENGNYLQYDETQPRLGEFTCCYYKNCLYTDWEYVGKPTPEQMPQGKEETNGRNE